MFIRQVVMEYIVELRQQGHCAQLIHKISVQLTDIYFLSIHFLVENILCSHEN